MFSFLNFLFYIFTAVFTDYRFVYGNVSLIIYLFYYCLLMFIGIVLRLLLFSLGIGVRMCESVGGLCVRITGIGLFCGGVRCCCGIIIGSILRVSLTLTFFT